MARTTMLVDGENLFMRSLYAGRKTAMTAQGVHTGPLAIMANILSRHVREEDPDRLLIAWDGGTSAARVARLPSYKAHRKTESQGDPDEEYHDGSRRIVQDFLALANIPGVRLTGVEADDLIAGAWRNVDPLATDKIVILSSDKDFLQLLGPNPHGVETEQIRMGSADTPTDRWTRTRFCDAYAYDPCYWSLVTALAGDTSDGVPGLPGVGPKTAQKLLEQSGWDWERLLDRVAGDHKVAKDLSGPQKRDLAQACRDVVDLRGITIPLTIPLWRPTDQTSSLWNRFDLFLTTYRLRVIQDQMRARTFWSNATESDGDGGVNLNEEASLIPGLDRSAGPEGRPPSG